MKNPEEFLEFNGKVILFTNHDGVNFIAIKPICEALGVDYIAQRKAIKRSNLFNQLWSKQTIVAKDNRLRKMLCFEERYIYGWIFSINSQSEELISYQRKCCDILFNYFHGTITKRSRLLNENKTEEEERLALIENLKESSDYLRLQEIEKNKKKRNKTLKLLDENLVDIQLSMKL